MKSALSSIIAIFLLAVKTTRGVPTGRIHPRKQATPSRAPLSGHEGIPLSETEVSLPLRSTTTLTKATRSSFKPLFRRNILALPAYNHNRNSKMEKGKSVDLSMGEESISSSQSSNDGVDSSTYTAGLYPYNDQDVYYSKEAAKRGAMYPHESKMEAKARRKHQSNLFHAKWREMNLSHKKVTSGQMADYIRGIDIQGMPRIAITRLAGRLIFKSAGLEYHGEVMKQLEKKGNSASLERYRERLKPASQRRKYIRVKPLKKTTKEKVKQVIH